MPGDISRNKRRLVDEERKASFWSRNAFRSRPTREADSFRDPMDCKGLRVRGNHLPDNAPCYRKGITRRSLIECRMACRRVIWYSLRLERGPVFVLNACCVSRQPSDPILALSGRGCAHARYIFYVGRENNERKRAKERDRGREREKGWKERGRKGEGDK